MLTGWQNLEKNEITSKYYFESNGALVTDTCITQNGNQYCFDSTGICISGNDC